MFHGNPASHVAIAFIREKARLQNICPIRLLYTRIDLPGNKTAYMPRYVKFDDIYTISDIISKPNLAIADILTLHAYASSTISKQEAAILTYSAYKDKAYGRKRSSLRSRNCIHIASEVQNHTLNPSLTKIRIRILCRF